MSKYFISTLSVICLLALIDILVSKTKNGRAVKTVISLVATFLLVTPIISIFKGGNIGDFDILSNELYLRYLENIEDETIKRRIKIALNVGNFEFYDVEVEFENDGENKNLKKVVIILDKGVIFDNSEHINMIEKAKELLKNEIDVLEVCIEMKPIEDEKLKSKKVNKIKKEYLIVIALSIAVIAIFLSGSSVFSSLKTSKKSADSYEETIEKRLENLLKEVEGVGKVEVFVTTDGTFSEEILKDVETKKDNGVSITQESVVLVGGKPYIVKTNNPNIIGVAVACQGGDNLNVKVLITEIISTTLSVDADRIRIIKMK